jgi:hypothetical protein
MHRGAPKSSIPKILENKIGNPEKGQAGIWAIGNLGNWTKSSGAANFVAPLGHGNLRTLLLAIPAGKTSCLAFLSLVITLFKKAIVLKPQGSEPVAENRQE